MKKKLLGYLIGLVIMVVLSTIYASVVLSYENTEVDYYIDGQQVTFPDQQPVIMDCELTVPIRSFFENKQVQYLVSFDQSTKTVTAEDTDCHVVTIVIGDKNITVRNTDTREIRNVVSDITPIIINGRTMLQLHTLAEVLELDVNRDEEENTIQLTTKPGKIRKIMPWPDWEKTLETHNSRG